jgi:hypothetical protein
MNTPTPTPRTDAATYPADCLGTTLVTNRDCARALETELVTFTGAYTCTHHNDQQRAACPVCLVAALTAERDQLRAEVERFKEWLADPHALHAHCLRTLTEGQIAHLFGELMTEIVNRAERAEAALAAEREKVRMLRAALENLCDEQNGAPLETRRDEWQLAIDEAREAIVATEGAT